MPAFRGTETWRAVGENTTDVPLQKLPTAWLSGEFTVFSAVRESYKVLSFVLLFSDACVLMLTKNNRGSNADI